MLMSRNYYYFLKIFNGWYYMKLKIKNFFIGGLLTTSVAASVTGVIILLNQNSLKPDYAVDQVDSHLQEDKDNSEKLTSAKGGGAVELFYSTDIKVINAEKVVSLSFKNPSKSNQDMSVKIAVIKDNKEYIIAESNRIPAGYILKELDLKSDVKLESGGYDGVIHVYYFNPETLERAVVDTNISANIVVE